MSNKFNPCHLCGEPIDTTLRDTDLKKSKEHVPPKQFYPKEIRQQNNLNLEQAPAHNKCNQSFRKDEEYFYHSLYPMVANGNPGMAGIIFKDFERRLSKPQTPAMMRKIIKTAFRKTSGGIHLPNGIVGLELDNNRLQKVAMKIARGVLCLNGTSYISESNCIDIRLCQKESDVPEVYQLSWQATPQPSGAFHKVFSYKYFRLDNHHYLTMFFWEAVMYCLCFSE